MVLCLFLFVWLAHSLTPREQFEAASPRIVGYWGANAGGHSSTIAQLKSSIQRGYNVIIYAFYDVDSAGNFNVDPGSVAAPSKSSLGGSFTYLISLFGGQNGVGPTLPGSANAWAQAMFSSFQKLRGKLGLDGIDIDLENAWGGTPDKIECGLRDFFMMMHNAGYVVSMAPQTTAVTPQVSIYSPGSWNSYVPLTDTSIAKYIDIVAVQLYNNAVPFNDAGKYLSSLSSGFKVTGCPCSASCDIKLNATKVAFGFPATQGAAPSGCPGYPGGCPYGSALSSLYNSNPVLLGSGGVMTWSIEWDEYGGWAFVNAARAIRFKQ